MLRSAVPLLLPPPLPPPLSSPLLPPTYYSLHPLAPVLQCLQCQTFWQTGSKPAAEAAAAGMASQPMNERVEAFCRRLTDRRIDGSLAAAKGTAELLRQ